MSHILKRFALLLFVVHLSSCSPIHQVGDAEMVHTPALLDHVDEGDVDSAVNAEITLTEAAISVNKALHEMVAVERAVHPRAKVPEPLDPVRIGMAHLASVDWSGPIHLLLKKIAQASHYQLHVLGKEPAVPILVSVIAKNTPLADIVRDISFQADKQAHIVLYPEKHIIELRYTGA